MKVMVTEKEARLFALECAKHVMHIYEEQYPSDRRLHDAYYATRSTMHFEEVLWLRVVDAAEEAGQRARETSDFFENSKRKASWRTACAVLGATIEYSDKHPPQAMAYGTSLAAVDAVRHLAEASSKTAVKFDTPYPSSDEVWQALYAAKQPAEWEKAFQAEKAWQRKRFLELIPVGLRLK